MPKHNIELLSFHLQCLAFDKFSWQHFFSVNFLLNQSENDEVCITGVGFRLAIYIYISTAQVLPWSRTYNQHCLHFPACVLRGVVVCFNPAYHKYLIIMLAGYSTTTSKFLHILGCNYVLDTSLTLSSLDLEMPLNPEVATKLDKKGYYCYWTLKVRFTNIKILYSRRQVKK